MSEMWLWVRLSSILREVAQRKARRVHVFKCQECGKEFRLSANDVELVNEAKVDGVQCCGGYCDEDRIEINVGTVLV